MTLTQSKWLLKFMISTINGGTKAGELVLLILTWITNSPLHMIDSSQFNYSLWTTTLVKHIHGSLLVLQMILGHGLKAANTYKVNINLKFQKHCLTQNTDNIFLTKVLEQPLSNLLQFIWMCIL